MSLPLGKKTLGSIFIANLKKTLKSRNITQKQLSTLAKVSNTQMSSLCNEEIGVTLIMAERLCLALQVDPITMLTDWEK